MSGRCHVCGQDGLRMVAGFADLFRVTSDCRPWPAGGALGVCAACGCVQKRVDDAWSDECRRLYAGYAIYSQGDGSEQSVFDAGGVAVPRSQRLLERLANTVALAPQGRLLDVGCGNGALLRAMSRRAPGWTMVGVEQDDRHRRAVEAIPGVERLHVGSLDALDGKFDLIALVHVLEHIADPVAFLRTLQRHLAPGGRFLIEVPDAARNPVDLLIADHGTHFSAVSLAGVLARAGLRPFGVARDWVPKELSAVADVGAGALPTDIHATAAVDMDIDADAAVAWLRAVAAGARRAADIAAAEGRPFGLFGSSIAATWLLSEVGARATFLVDEDPARAGHRHEGRPIIAPGDVAALAHVYLGLAPVVAQAVRARLQGGGARGVWHLPPDLTAA